MKSNIGLTDRVVRMLLGVAIASLAIYHNSAWALIGIPVFVSGIGGACLLYSVFKINTFGKADREFN